MKMCMFALGYNLYTNQLKTLSVVVKKKKKKNLNFHCWPIHYDYKYDFVIEKSDKILRKYIASCR